MAIYIGIAEKVNTEKFRQYQRILANTENFPVNNIVRSQEEMIKKALTGKRVSQFSIGEHGPCRLVLSEGWSLSIETLCRYIRSDEEFLSSQDHGHQFGLLTPFDAAKEIGDRIKEKEITWVIRQERKTYEDPIRTT